MRRLVVSMAERIARGEIIEERRIERLKRKPRGCVGENWKEELREQNRKNICEELKRRGYEDVFYIRRWNEETKDYFGFVRIEWIEMVVGEEGKDMTAIWDIGKIEQVLKYNRKRRMGLLL